MMSEVANENLESEEKSRESTTNDVSDVSLSSQAFLTPKSKVSLLEKRVKLWKARYKSLLAKTQLKKQSPLEKLKFYRQLHKSKRRNSTENLILFLESRYWKMKRVNSDLISNNRDLARSLAQLRIESQEHCAESLNYQRELQTIQENIEMAVSSRLLVLLADLSQPIIEKIDESLASAQEQTSRMTTARKMICALAEVVQRNESTANLSYDDTDSSLGRDSLNTSERKRSLLRKDGSADSTSRGEEANGGLDGFIAKRWSCSKGTSNRRCKVMPMVMGHVLQQPKLALPKMDPQTLRAIARENREVARMENGFDMTIINERDMLDDDPENVSAAVEDDVSPDGSGHVSDSVSRPVISHLLQNTEVPGNFRSRLLANMAGCKNKGRLVPRVNINADCSAAAIAPLLASQKSTVDCHRSEADEILNSSSFSDEELSEESLNDFQSRYPNLFAADCKLATLDFTDRATQNAEVGRTVDPTWSPSPLQGLSLIDSLSVFSSGERDSNPDGNGNKSDSNSENGGRGKRSISRSKHPVSEKILQANNAQTEVSDSLGSVEPNGNAKFSSTNEDPLEGPSWLYSSEAPSACCSFNQETSNFATRSGKSSSIVQCSNEAYDDGLFVDANNVRDTPSTLATALESGKQCGSSDIQQSNCINSTNLPQLRVEENSENFDSENIPDIQEPLQGPFRKNSLAHRGRGRKSKIEASCSLNEATVLQRNVESPLDNATHTSSKETEEASTSACSGTHAFPRNVATGRANGKGQLKLEDLPRCKKAVVDETCLEEEPMEITLPIPSSNSSDFLQSFKVNKHNQNGAMKSVNKTAGKDGVSVCDIVEVTDHSRAKSLRGAKGKQQINPSKGKPMRCAAENCTEFDFSQMEATVLNIPAYSPARKFQRTVAEESSVKSPAKRLSVVLVDLCKTEDAKDVAKDSLNVNENENTSGQDKRARNEKSLEDNCANIISDEMESSKSIAKRNKRRERFTTDKSEKERLANVSDKRKRHSNTGLSLSVSSKRSRRNGSVNSNSNCASEKIMDCGDNDSIFINVLESSEPDPLRLELELDPLEDLLPDVLPALTSESGTIVDPCMNQSPIDSKKKEMSDTPQKHASGKSSATCVANANQNHKKRLNYNGNGEDASSSDCGAAVTGHPRRAASKSVSYVEPKLNRKLRQGDPLSVRPFGRDEDAVQASKTAKKKIYKKLK